MTIYAAIAMNRKRQIIILEDNTVLPFVNMLDCDGDDTDDPDKCVIAIIQLPNEKFTGVVLAQFDDETSLH